MKRRLTMLAAALAASLATAAVSAASLQLVVTDADGRPAPDVVVLLETRDGAPPLPAAAPVVIAQEKLRFVPFLSVVPRGSTLRFVNRDGYDHHVRSTPSGPLGQTPPAQSFELRLAPAPGSAAARPGTGHSVDVRVDQAGPIGLGCHLHSSMRGQVYVADTPHATQTDADGRARLDGLPDGPATLTVWHADQLQAQPARPLVLGAAPAELALQLNFVPRPRRR